MNNNKLSYKIVESVKEKSTISIEENIYEPLETLKIARTVVPTNRTTYNKTWEHIYNQLKLN